MNTTALTCLLSLVMGIVFGAAGGCGYGIAGGILGGFIGLGVGLIIICVVMQVDQWASKLAMRRAGLCIVITFATLTVAVAVSCGASFLLAEAAARSLGLHPSK